MMLKSQIHQVACQRPMAGTARVAPRVAAPRSRTVVRAEESDSSAPPAVDFTPNTQAASGYVEFDTAGQSNMYPVITKAYEAGSSADTADTGAANLVVGVGAAVIAGGVLAVGLGALSQQGNAVADSVEQFKSLSEYASMFAAEL